MALAVSWLNPINLHVWRHLKTSLNTAAVNAVATFQQQVEGDRQTIWNIQDILNVFGNSQQGMLKCYEVLLNDQLCKYGVTI
jgi:hypothetical protein